MSETVKNLLEQIKDHREQIGNLIEKLETALAKEAGGGLDAAE
jgi:hypothetical protein